MKVPARKRLLISNRRTIIRDVKGASSVLVKEGDRVSPEDIVARFKTTVVRGINVAERLKIEPSLVRKFLTKKEGERVMKEEVLAIKKGTLSIGRKVIKSPFSGELVRVQEDTGEVSLKESERDMNQAAGCWGKISEVKDGVVEIETRTSEVVGVFGTSGEAKEGFFKVLAGRSELLLPSGIDRRVEGKIVFCGALLSRESFSKLRSVGAKGVVAGGVHYFEFVGFPSDMPLVLTEGFGTLPVAGDIFEVLERYNDYYVILDPNSHRLIIPLPFDSWKKDDEVEGAQEVELREGMTVRIIGGSNFGLVGTVKKMAGEEEFPSGLKSLACEIEIDGQIVRAPVCNLEALI